MAARAQVIGRVAVKVIPDTDDFRHLAQRALEKEEKRLRAQARVLIDRSQLKREAFDAIRDLNRSLQHNKAYRIRFFATISKTGMREAVAEAAANLNRRADREKIKFDAELVKVELDREALKVVERELEHWRDKISPLEVEVKPSMWTGAASYINARLKILTRPREVQIVPVLNKPALVKVGAALAALAGARVIGDALDNIWDKLKRLDKSVPIIGTIAEAIAGLGGYAGTAASNLFALSQSLAQIGPAVLALPGIFGGITIGIGTTIAALKDFNKVLPEVKDKFAKLQDQISRRFWAEAEEPIRNLINSLLPELSAGLRQTATELGGFFGKLADAFRGVFNGALKGMFEDLSSSILIMSVYVENLANIIKILGEVGAGYLPSLAQWFGSLLVRFDNFLTKAQNDGSLRNWIDMGIMQLQELGRALGNLGGIFRGLAQIANAAGGSTLTMFADTLERIEQTVKGNTFQTIMTNSLRAAHQAMSTIAQISGPSVERFFIALGKTSTKVFPIMAETVGTALKAIFDALSQPAVSNGLVQMFKGLNEGMKGLAPAAGPIGKALGELFKIIGAFGANEGKAAGAIFTSLANAFTKLGPTVRQVINLMGAGFIGAIKALTPAFESLVGLIGNVLTKYVLPAMTNIMPKVQKGLREIGKAVAPALDALGELVGILAPVLLPVMKLLASILIDTIVFAFKGVSNVIQGVVDVIAGLIGFIKSVFTGDWKGAWDNIKRIGEGIWKLIVGAFQLFISVGLGKILKIGMGLIKGLWKGAWTAVKGAGKAVWTAIQSLFKGFWNTMKNLPKGPLNAIKGLITRVWNAIKGFFKSVWNAIVSVVKGYLNIYKSIVTTAFNVVRSVVSKALNAAKSIVSKAWNAIKSFFSGGVSKVVSTVKQLPGKIKAALGNLGGLLVGAGKAIVGGLISGIKSMFGKLQSALKWVTDKIPDWKGPLPKDRKLLYATGRVIIDGLVKGLESRFGQVKSALARLTDGIYKTGNAGLAKATRSARLNLSGLLYQYDRAAKQLKAAQQKLKQIREEAEQYAQSIRDAVFQTGNITGFADDGGNTSFDRILSGLRNATTKAWEFASVLKKLDTMGLSKAAIDQIAQAGPEAGLAAANAIIDAGKAGIDQLNSLMSSLGAAAGAAGNYASDAMYKSGIHAAQGLIDGLEKQMGRIAKAMTKIARKMVTVIKRQLGIHSPSRVFADLGGYVGQGFTKGVERERQHVLAAMSTLTEFDKSDLGSTGASLIDDFLVGMESKYEAVRESLRGLGSEIAKTEIEPPKITGIDTPNMAAKVSGAVSASVSEEGAVIKQLNYYAAPGSSLDSEEDLFAAASRARMAW